MKGSASKNDDLLLLLPPPSDYSSQPSSSRHQFSPSMMHGSSDCQAYGSTSPSREIDVDSYHAATVSIVEHTMKKYTDNLLIVLEGMSGKLSELESNAQSFELLLGEVTMTVANNHGEVDARLRMLQNHVTEVQHSVQVMHDKQEICEARADLVKLQEIAVKSSPGTSSETKEKQYAKQEIQAPTSLPSFPQQSFYSPQPQSLPYYSSSRASLAAPTSPNSYVNEPPPAYLLSVSHQTQVGPVQSHDTRQQSNQFHPMYYQSQALVPSRGYNASLYRGNKI